MTENIGWGSFKRNDIEIPQNSIIPCRKCQGIMKKKWNEGIILDSNPPIYGWDWKCQDCGKIENGGYECSGKYYILFYLDDKEMK